MPGPAPAAVESLLSTHGSPQSSNSRNWITDEYDNLKLESNTQGLTLRTGERVSGSAFKQPTIKLLNLACPRRAASPTSMVREAQDGGGLGFVAQTSPIPTGHSLLLSAGASSEKVDGNSEQDAELLEGLNAALEITEPAPTHMSLAEDSKESFSPICVAVARPPPANARLAQIPADGISAHDFASKFRSQDNGNMSTSHPQSLPNVHGDDQIREVPLRVTGMIGSHEKLRPSTAYRQNDSAFSLNTTSVCQIRSCDSLFRLPQQTGQRPRKLDKLKIAPKIKADPDPQSIMLCGKAEKLSVKSCTKK